MEFFRSKKQIRSFKAFEAFNAFKAFNAPMLLFILFLIQLTSTTTHQSFKVTISTFNEFDDLNNPPLPHKESIIHLDADHFRLTVPNKSSFYNPVKSPIKTLKYEDFLFFDNDISFKYRELPNLSNRGYISFQEKIDKGLNLLLLTTPHLKIKGLILFRKQHVLPGVFTSDTIFQIVALLFEPESENLIDIFKTQLLSRYINVVANVKNKLSLQSLIHSEKVELQTYSNSMSDETALPLEFFVSSTSNGVTMAKKNCNVSYSFRYSQLLSCFSELDPRNKFNREIVSHYNSQCLIYIVDWNSNPAYNLFCSTLTRDDKARAQMLVFESTVYRNCFKDGIKELSLELQNRGGSLGDSKLPVFKRLKYIKLLDEIANLKFENYMQPNSPELKDYNYLKTGAVLWMAELIEGAVSDDNPTPPNLGKYSQPTHPFEKFDLGTNSETETTPEISIFDMINEQMKDYAKQIVPVHHNHPYSIMNYDPNQSIIKKIKFPKEKLIEKLIDAYDKGNSRKSPSANEKAKLLKFIENNAPLLESIINKLGVSSGLVDDIIDMKEPDLKSKYGELLMRPGFEFEYDKKTSGKVIPKSNINKSDRFKNWNKGPKQITSDENNDYGQDVEIKPHLDPLNYKNAIGFDKKKPIASSSNKPKKTNPPNTNDTFNSQNNYKPNSNKGSSNPQKIFKSPNKSSSNSSNIYLPSESNEIDPLNSNDLLSEEESPKTLSNKPSLQNKSEPSNNQEVDSNPQSSESNKKPNNNNENIPINESNKVSDLKNSNTSNKPNKPSNSSKFKSNSRPNSSILPEYPNKYPSNTNSSPQFSSLNPNSNDDSIDDHESLDPVNLNEDFIEPPIIPAEKSKSQQEKTITTPTKQPLNSTFKPISSELKIDEEDEPETFNENTSPMDNSMTLGLGEQTKPNKSDKPISKLDVKCTACIPECKDVYPGCLKCPNPNNPKDPACADCTPNREDYPNCRKEGESIPQCPDGKITCCIKGRPNYPECLCEDPQTQYQCCEKFPNKDFCKNKAKEKNKDDIKDEGNNNIIDGDKGENKLNNKEGDKSNGPLMYNDKPDSRGGLNKEVVNSDGNIGNGNGNNNNNDISKENDSENPNLPKNNENENGNGSNFNDNNNNPKSNSNTVNSNQILIRRLV